MALPQLPVLRVEKLKNGVPLLFKAILRAYIHYLLMYYCLLFHFHLFLYGNGGNCGNAPISTFFNSFYERGLQRRARWPLFFGRGNAAVTQSSPEGERCGIDQHIAGKLRMLAASARMPLERIFLDKIQCFFATRSEVGYLPRPEPVG